MGMFLSLDTERTSSFPLFRKHFSVVYHITMYVMCGKQCKLYVTYMYNVYYTDTTRDVVKIGK